MLQIKYIQKGYIPLARTLAHQLAILSDAGIRPAVPTSSLASLVVLDRDSSNDGHGGHARDAFLVGMPIVSLASATTHGEIVADHALLRTTGPEWVSDHVDFFFRISYYIGLSPWFCSLQEPASILVHHLCFAYSFSSLHNGLLLPQDLCAQGGRGIRTSV